ncbi:MAG: HDIG domain-containing protein, partial [Planctomycetes bacterium]|nr:HDIG domain-containing protein [Planctomycetota bacterium]
ALTFDRIRADLRQLYDTAADATSFEGYEQALTELGWPADANSYDRLRQLADRADDAGRAQFEQWIDDLPVEGEYIADNLRAEPRDPKSTLDYIVLGLSQTEGGVETVQIPHAQLVSRGNEKALRGSAWNVARRFASSELRQTVEAIVLAAFQAQPTIIFDQGRTVEEMRKAEEATPVAQATYEGGKPFIEPGILSAEGHELLKAEHGAYLAFLEVDSAESAELRQQHVLRQVGLAVLLGVLSIGLLVYTRLYQPRIFEVPSRTVAFAVLTVGTLLAAKLLDVRWGHIGELIYAPCLLAGGILAIVYPRRFAIEATSILAVLITVTIEAGMAFLLPLLVGVAATVYQLNEIRSRTKIISVGLTASVAVMLVSSAAGLAQAHPLHYVLQHALWAGAAAMLASFVLSGTLPFIEQAFRIATSLTLLEWRDPTKLLLQLLAREVPGTYNHSLVLGTLAEAACNSIGANGLLAQVGALYHDIGKIPKSEYFSENQQGRINRHDNLAPTMSLLIILGHVKDGIEMAKEYKLPRLLHQFIAEHHGTSVVRYFHHMASEKQPQIASGKHDREVSEAEFRYSGPKPRSRESAIVMLCDGVESAVRALSDPAPGRIESAVSQVVADRLNDGQLSDCDMTMREIQLVQESLVKSVCSIYHGRVAYPKAKGAAQAPAEPERVSV